MEVGALIVAAGMSRRMGEFKPMLPIGSISVAQRVVATLSQAGVSKIVMVTGCNARTVKTLLDSGAPLAVPMCGGRQGHPILIANGLIPEILRDSGEMGLKGAMDRCSVPPLRIDVEDLGTIHDTDTPEDFSLLLEYHNSQLVRPVVSVSLTREKPFFDSKIAMLLMLVDETNSVRAAGQRMHLSYSSCWNIIRTLESQLNYTLIERSQGGAGGSQSRLTDRGRLLLEHTAYEKQLKEQANALYDRYFGGLFE